MSDNTQFAIITLENSTDDFVSVIAKIGYQELFITDLGPGETTTQLTPTGTQWELRSVVVPVDSPSVVDEPEIAHSMSTAR